MKTKSFLLGAAALMLATACSNEEVVEVAPQSAAIGFHSFVNNSTRGDLTYINLSDLKVWGVTSRGIEITATEIFSGQTVTKGSAVSADNEEAAIDTKIWTYSPLRYWVAGNAYSFAAVAPADATENGLTVAQTPSNDVDSEAGLTLTFDNSTAQANKDLLYATANVQNALAAQDPVQLDLKHMLSRVRFNFVNNWPAAAADNATETIEISDVKITNATKVASITKAGVTGTWTEPTGATENTFVVSFPVKKAVNGNIPTEHKYLIPLTDKVSLNLSFVIKRMKDEVVIATYNHENVPLYTAEDGGFNFRNNCSYTFTATIDEKSIDPNNDELKPIQFTATLSDWEPWEDEKNPVAYTNNINLPKNPKDEAGNSSEE